MKKIQIMRRNAISNVNTYHDNNNLATVFLRHSEDKIHIRNGDQVEIEVIDNGKTIFIGTKLDFYERLTGKSQEQPEPSPQHLVQSDTKQCCKKYPDCEVLTDENDNCSLCGSNTNKLGQCLGDGITRQQFLDYLRSDRYNEEMSADDCLEVFVTSIKGSSDLSVELLNEILSDYGADFEVQEKPKGLLHELIHSHKHGDTKYYFRCVVNCDSYDDDDTALTDFEKMLIEKFDIEYEPEVGDSIRINEIDISGAEFVMPMFNHNQP